MKLTAFFYGKWQTPTFSTHDEAFAVQSIEISLDSTSKAVSTLDLMPLTSIPVGILGAIHLDT
ncbi:uncharacterized protein N7518_000206, partial [Penicillium psychrosexuale]|uniref:uncharacterized protein n=1 Tax=Penicillium psychrosexuale TaxID=1002107 RepID=UPI0025456D25